MTLNILVTSSLLALVVTARPLKDVPQSSVKRSLEVQNAIQAIFESRTGQSPDCLGCDKEDEVHVSLTTSEEQSALLSRIEDLDAIKAIIPLNIDGTPSEDEQQLYKILKNLQSTGSLDDIDGNVLPLPGRPTPVTPTEAASKERVGSSNEASQEIPTYWSAPVYALPPLIVVTVSCIVALLAVFCVGAGLYAYNRINSIMIKSGLAWDVLPRLERRIGLDMSHDDNEDGSTPPPEKHKLIVDTALFPVNVFQEKLVEGFNGKAMLVDVSEPLSDDEGLDEKFHDAPEYSLLFLDAELSPQYHPRPDVPRIVVEEHADPDLLPLPDTHSDQSTPFSTPLPAPARSTLANPVSPVRSPVLRMPQMREVQSSPTPSSKPLWSIRAADASPLILTDSLSPASGPRSDTPAPQLPGALFSDDAPEMVQRPRQRLPRQPLDIAFALQLRPGLGLGADSAWLVRFLMAMFGWMTFFIGGNGAVREGPRRALTASR